MCLGGCFRILSYLLSNSIKFRKIPECLFPIVVLNTLNAKLFFVQNKIASKIMRIIYSYRRSMSS